MRELPTLAQRRERAILELDNFLCRECGATRIPSTEVSGIGNRGFVTGWRVEVQPLQAQRRMNVCVDGFFPFSAPRFQLVSGPPFLTWPHVEEDGMLCVGDETQTTDPSRPVEIARQLLVQSVFPLLRACENGGNREDFRTEFYSYWNATVPDGEPPIHSILSPKGPSRIVQIWRGQYFSAVGETEESVLRWLRNRYGNQKQFDVTESCCLVWMNQVLLPSEYPRRSSDVRGIAKSSGALELLEESAGKERRYIPVVLCSSSSNGPCFAAVTIRSVQKTGISGFRPGHAPSKILADRVLGSSASVNRAGVARADASWIHGRDQDARQSVLASRRIAIVGCGAIGGPVAVALAMAGAGHLMLIDPDSLGWANVGRHPLGAESVGLKKASELAKKLAQNFPHARFESRTEELRVVLEKEEGLLLNCDLVVCATGVWSVESALNAWHVSTKHPAQILYAWTEPHACAGHAVAILPDEACLQCQFTQFGEAKKIVTDWKGRSEQQEPACGAVYQPYGPIELSWVTALGTGLALDCLVGNIKASTHRIWASPKALLDAAGGSWNTDWIGENKARESGGFLEERRWERDSHCAICG